MGVEAIVAREWAPEPGTVVADPTRLGHGWRAERGRWDEITWHGVQRCHGYATRSGPSMVALYAAGGTVCLQAGPRAWDCAAVSSVIQVGTGLRWTEYEITSQAGDTARLRVRVPYLAAMRRLLDPRFDAVDSWWDDLIQMLPVGGGDVGAWVRGTHSTWSKGFDHGIGPLRPVAPLT